MMSQLQVDNGIVRIVKIFNVGWIARFVIDSTKKLLIKNTSKSV